MAIKQQIYPMRQFIYHGSNVIVEHPDIRIRGYEKDFGYGFYCTNLERQAKKWALTKGGGHVVSIYEFAEYDGCKTKIFETMTEEWLDFVVACRMGIRHDYDIVEGPMADDTIWNFVEDLVAGTISREAFWALVKFKYPTHQIVFCTQKSLECIKYISNFSL